MKIEDLTSLLGRQINDVEIIEFCDKYNITIPKRNMVFRTGHESVDYLNIDAKQECGLFLIFQVETWNPIFEIGDKEDKIKEYLPMLTSVVLYEHPNGLDEVPFNLKYGMTLQEVEQRLGKSPKSPYIPQILEKQAVPQNWYIPLIPEEAIACYIHVFEGKLLNSITLTTNTFTPLFYVNHPLQYEYKQGYVFLQWAIRNNYFPTYPPYQVYEDRLKNAKVEDVESLLQDELNVSAVYVNDFPQELHPFLFNYFYDNRMERELITFDRDFMHCDCDTIEDYDDEAKKDKKRKQYEVLFDLISERLHSFQNNTLNWEYPKEK